MGRINEIDLGPIPLYFCPICCDGNRFTSDYNLRLHLKQQHGEMKRDNWEISKRYINGSNSIREFYDECDDQGMEFICEFDQ